MQLELNLFQSKFNWIQNIDCNSNSIGIKLKFNWIQFSKVIQILLNWIQIQLKGNTICDYDVGKKTPKRHKYEKTPKFHSI
jgi:hypothetical protein